ncbi:DUF397 domain-containing protein [Lentzea sp. NEAU-D7]|uniref:DUF397 domain-containing protein n=1 Tax=Lentzea sp. NEAU-D7 TaxID=2994667 RepID=UPI00224A67CB|nr:DUF397 domain-containing protein [Lentzea sp. NEAU-D7]MCX2951885.1 DUF397 domain-containing protein [Lentzea sp. NEAU-D7]
MTAERIWRKSTYSGDTASGSCVEVSLSADARVRDSKAAGGDVLAFSVSAWRAFVVSVA